MAAAVADTPNPQADDAALAKYWISELDTAEKDPRREEWLLRAKAIIRVYTRKADESAAQTTESLRKRFALFWSNIEVLKPATLARTPTAVASRRFKESDPTARLASEILERALNFSIDTYDFAGVLFGCRDEFLLLARGVSWVRYIPHIKTKSGQGASVEVTDDAEGYEVVDWEEVRADYINYDDFLTNVARQWPEVRWGARKAYMTRTELTDRFGDKGKTVALDYSPPEKAEGGGDENAKKACVYEIWDRVSKKAIWIAKGCSEYPLDVRDDPLKLKDFFPFPKPAIGTIGPDSIIPTPDYIYYQDQCDEIDTLTARIGMLIDALKVRGFYSASQGTDLNTLLSSGNNTLIPVDSWAALGDKGGLKGIIEWMPIDLIAQTIRECIATRKEIISDVFQLTGISDIQRGDTDPNETASAQQLKASFGSSRISERKKEMARLARDTLEIKAQIIASRFSPETLGPMTGTTLIPTNAEKQQLQQAVQAFQQAQQAAQAPPQPGAPPAPPPPMPPAPDPEKVKLLEKPSWEDIMALLKNPSLREYRIDIETDSTVDPNDAEEKAGRVEFVTAVGQYLANSLPVVQANPAILPVISQGLLFLVRGFRVGREMEDVIESAMEELQKSAQSAPPQQDGPAAPDPAVEQAKAQAAVTSSQAAMKKAENEGQANAIEAMSVQSNHAIGMAQVDAERERTQAEIAMSVQDTFARQREQQEQRQHEAAHPPKPPGGGS